jgi:hypothetical protein
MAAAAKYNVGICIIARALPHNLQYWARWVSAVNNDPGGNVRLSLYLHAYKDLTRTESLLLRSTVEECGKDFPVETIPTQGTSWGDWSLVEVELQLYRQAIISSDAAGCILVSGDSIPVLSPTAFRLDLEASLQRDHSLLAPFGDVNQKEVTDAFAVACPDVLQALRKSLGIQDGRQPLYGVCAAQWKFLTRYAMEVLLQYFDLHPAVLKYWQAALRTEKEELVFHLPAPDEVVIPTVLHQLQVPFLAGREVVHVAEMEVGGVGNYHAREEEWISPARSWGICSSRAWFYRKFVGARPDLYLPLVCPTTAPSVLGWTAEDFRATAKELPHEDLLERRDEVVRIMDKLFVAVRYAPGLPVTYVDVVVDRSLPGAFGAAFAHHHAQVRVGKDVTALVVAEGGDYMATVESHFRQWLGVDELQPVYMADPRHIAYSGPSPGGPACYILPAGDVEAQLVQLRRTYPEAYLSLVQHVEKGRDSAVLLKMLGIPPVTPRPGGERQPSNRRKGGPTRICQGSGSNLAWER